MRSHPTEERHSLVEHYDNAFTRFFARTMNGALTDLKGPLSAGEREEFAEFRALCERRMEKFSEGLAVFDAQSLKMSDASGREMLMRLERHALQVDIVATVNALVNWTRERDARLAEVGGAILLESMLFPEADDDSDDE